MGPGISSFIFVGAPKVIDMTCVDSMKSMGFEGKPGTIYQINCPIDCDK